MGEGKKIAYCAPGRETISALSLAWKEVDFDEIRASPAMEGRKDIILVDHGAIDTKLDISLRTELHLRPRPPRLPDTFRLLNGI